MPAKRRAPTAELAWAIAVASCLVWAMVHFSNDPHLLDLSVYRAEGFAVRHGLDLYGPIGAPYDLRATYPPFAALAFVPLTAVPAGACIVLVTVANVALLVAVVGLTARMLCRDDVVTSPLLVPLATAAGVWLQPVSATLRFGQINLLILALVLWDFAREPGSRCRGAALGLAVGLKVTPACFLVYLLLTRRTRFAVTATTTFAATAVASWLVLPGETWRYWSSVLFQIDRVGDAMSTENQSLHGLLTRALDRPDVGVGGVVLTGLVAVAGLFAAVRAYRLGGELWGVCTTAVTALLTAPISWSHHWVWCIPIALLLLRAGWAGGWGRRLALGLPLLAFVSYAHLSSPITHSQDPDLGLGVQVISSPYPLFGLVLLLVLCTPLARLIVEPTDRGGAQRRMPVWPSE
jgi:alpha-1,2-mannosyltransferase